MPEHSGDTSDNMSVALIDSDDEVENDDGELITDDDVQAVQALNTTTSQKRICHFSFKQFFFGALRLLREFGLGAFQTYIAFYLPIACFYDITGEQDGEVVYEWEQDSLEYLFFFQSVMLIVGASLRVAMYASHRLNRYCRPPLEALSVNGEITGIKMCIAFFPMRRGLSFFFSPTTTIILAQIAAVTFGVSCGTIKGLNELLKFFSDKKSDLFLRNYRGENNESMHLNWRQAFLKHLKRLSGYGFDGAVDAAALLILVESGALWWLLSDEPFLRFAPFDIPEEVVIGTYIAGMVIGSVLREGVYRTEDHWGDKLARIMLWASALIQRGVPAVVAACSLADNIGGGYELYTDKTLTYPQKLLLISLPTVLVSVLLSYWRAKDTVNIYKFSEHYPEYVASVRERLKRLRCIKSELIQHRVSQLGLHLALLSKKGPQPHNIVENNEDGRAVSSSSETPSNDAQPSLPPKGALSTIMAMFPRRSQHDHRSSALNRPLLREYPAANPTHN